MCNNIRVVIRCMTFNHKPYIRQCLDGFVMQKTDFPYVAIVVDDASTDNEQEVLWDFINNELDAKTKQQDETDDYVKVIATHKTNCNCTFVFLFLKYNHYSIKKDKKTYLRPWEEKTKYIAICEGDDYWTDPLKLQKQINILNNNHSVMLVHSAFMCVDEKGDPIEREQYNFFMRESKNGDVFERLLKGNYILTLTTCFRKEVLDNPLYTHCLYSMDYNCFLSAASLGDFYYFDEVMGCYRMNPSSITMTNMDRVVSTSKNIRNYYHVAILNNKIPKYTHFQLLHLKYKTVLFAWDQFRWKKNKEPMELMKKVFPTFHFYLFLVILVKAFNKMFKIR